MMKKFTALMLTLMLLTGALSTAFAWSCPSCGTDNGGKFCTECGTQKPADILCPSCGTNYGDAAPKFCMECGTKLGETAPATPTPAPAGEAAEIMLFPLDDGRSFILWEADGETEYEIRYFPKKHDNFQDDMTDENMLGLQTLTSTLGMATLSYMVPGQAYWVGVFDGNGQGEYIPYVPEGPVQPFDGFETKLETAEVIQADGKETYPDALFATELASGVKGVNGLYLVLLYNNPGEEQELLLQLVFETPDGKGAVFYADTVTVPAAKEDGMGWRFLDLNKYAAALIKHLGEIPLGEYKASIYLDGMLAGTAPFQVEEAAAPELTITGVEDMHNGTHLLTWTDNGEGPWDVRFVEHWSDDFEADKADARSSAYWSHSTDLKDPSCTLSHLVPGTSYWIRVEDNTGKAATVVYDMPGGDSSLNAWIEAWPRLSKDDAYTDVEAFSTEMVNSGTDGSCGLYLKIHYDPVSADTQKFSQFVLTLPNGVNFCIDAFNMNMYTGGYTYWNFIDLEWALGRTKAWYGEALAGEYRLEVYVEGKHAAGTSFYVTEDGKLPEGVQAATVHGVKITGVLENANGSATITWTDEYNRGPYEIDYVQKFSEDYEADRSASIGYWYATKEATGGSYDLFDLVPGQTYWVAVYDANGYGQHTTYTPAAVQAFPEFTVKLRSQPKLRTGGSAVSVSEFSSAEIGAELSEHGLYLMIDYPQLARARDYLGVVAITAPDGSRVVNSYFDLHLNSGKASSIGWEFLSLDWYFGILQSSLGACPVGAYTVELFFDGEIAATASFNMTN